MAIETKVLSGGVWRLITQPEVLFSGTWRQITTIEVKSGGVWRLVFNSVLPPIVVVAATKTISRLDTEPQNVHADVKVDSDGDLYASFSDGNYPASYETWLDQGTTSQVWIQRVIISGTLTTDAGSGRLATTSDRIYGITRTSPGVKNAVIDLNWYDAASGGSLLDTQRVTLRAEQDTEE